MQRNGCDTRDGFHVLRDQFSPPADATQLAPETKRRITICHLFLNYKLSIKEVAKTLDESYKHAVRVLIEQGIIQERRSVGREESHEKQTSLFGSRLRNPGE